MITKILSDIESDVESKIYIEQKKLTAIRSIAKLLKQIDFSAEVVPYENNAKLSHLLVSLKGMALNEEEIKLIDTIVQN